MVCSRTIYKGEDVEVSIPFLTTGWTSLYVEYFTYGDTKVVRQGDELEIDEYTITATFSGDDLDLLDDGVLYYTIHYVYDDENYIKSSNTPYVLKTPAGYDAKTEDEIYEAGYEAGLEACSGGCEFLTTIINSFEPFTYMSYTTHPLVGVRNVKLNGELVEEVVSYESTFHSVTGSAISGLDTYRVKIKDNKNSIVSGYSYEYAVHYDDKSPNSFMYTIIGGGERSVSSQTITLIEEDEENDKKWYRVDTTFETPIYIDRYNAGYEAGLAACQGQ